MEQRTDDIELCAALEEACDAAELTEALANAARQALACLPYLPRGREQHAIGRLFRLVEATADAAAKTLAAIDSGCSGPRSHIFVSRVFHQL